MEFKRNLTGPALFPKISFLDGKYMFSLPKEQTINTVIDAFSHATEGYLSGRANNFSDTLALESIKLIGNKLNILENENISLEDRDTLLYASMLAGIVIAQTGTTVAHGMGYSLTYYKGEDHGRANGLIFPAFLRHSMKAQKGKVTTLLTTLGINSIEEFEQTLKELLGNRQSLTLEEIDHFAEKASKTGNVHNTLPIPTKDDIVQMYKESFL